jgi:hypothetical protein
LFKRILSDMLSMMKITKEAIKTCAIPSVTLLIYRWGLSKYERGVIKNMTICTR